MSRNKIFLFSILSVLIIVCCYVLLTRFSRYSIFKRNSNNLIEFSNETIVLNSASLNKTKLAEICAELDIWENGVVTAPASSSPMTITRQTPQEIQIVLNHEEYRTNKIINSVNREIISSSYTYFSDKTLIVEIGFSQSFVESQPPEIVEQFINKQLLGTLFRLTKNTTNAQEFEVRESAINTFILTKGSVINVK